MATPMLLPPEGVAAPSHPLPIVDISGVGTAAGVAYGEACRSQVHDHLAAVLDHARRTAGLGEEELFARARPYRAAVRSAMPSLADEIDGLATGAGIPEAAAWLLQLRAEVLHGEGTDTVLECTSFGATGAATFGNSTLAGQNGDLPTFYQDFLVLVRRTQPDRPRYLTLTPAGQVAWHGMNEDGVAVFANFLYCDGWRVGFPRYLFSRVALEEGSARAAVSRLRSMHRASPRNVLIADEREVLDVELDVEESAVMETVNGLIAHANHHLSRLGATERGTEQLLANSRTRQQRIEGLLAAEHGRIDVAAAAAVLRDRADVPHALSIDPADEIFKGESTIASTIADVRNRHLWVAIGPPHLSTYHRYSV